MLKPETIRTTLFRIGVDTIPALPVVQRISKSSLDFDLLSIASLGIFDLYCSYLMTTNGIELVKEVLNPGIPVDQATVIVALAGAGFHYSMTGLTRLVNPDFRRATNNELEAIYFAGKRTASAIDRIFNK